MYATAILNVKAGSVNENEVSGEYRGMGIQRTYDCWGATLLLTSDFTLPSLCESMPQKSPHAWYAMLFAQACGDAVRLISADIAECFEGVVDIGVAVGFTHMPDTDDFATQATHTTGSEEAVALAQRGDNLSGVFAGGDKYWGHLGGVLGIGHQITYAHAG